MAGGYFIKVLYIFIISYHLCFSETKWTTAIQVGVTESVTPLPDEYSSQIDGQKTYSTLENGGFLDDQSEAGLLGIQHVRGISPITSEDLITQGNIDEVVSDVLNQAELKNPIVLRTWRVNPPPTDHRSVSVDSSVVTMLIEVHSQRMNPVFTVLDPSGSLSTPSVANATMIVNINHLKIMKISNPAPGNWTIKFHSKEEYNVTVRGSSIVQFRSEFINAWGIPLSGRPVVGSNLTLRIELLGNKYVKKLSEVVLTTLEGTAILTKHLAQPIGRRHKTYRVDIKTPGEDFRITIRGIDTKSHVIERTVITPIIPSGIKLSLKALTPGAVEPGGDFKLQYVVVNDAKDGGNFTVSAFSAMPGLITFTVNSGNMYVPARGRARGTITVHVSSDVIPGTKSNIYVEATNTSGDFQISSRQIEVFAPQYDDDTHAPDFLTTSIIDNCHSAESSSTWQVVFQVQDDESGIHKVDVDDHTVSTITMETFYDGQAKSPVKGHINTTCSRKQVTVIVDDVNGNEGRFVVTHGKDDQQVTSNGNSPVDGDKPLTAVLTGFLGSCLLVVIIVSVAIQYYIYKREEKRKVSPQKCALSVTSSDRANSGNFTMVDSRNSTIRSGKQVY